MRLHDTTFFVDKEDIIICHIDPSLYSGQPLIRINKSQESKYDNPQIDIFLNNEQQLINFKNSVISAYESYERNKHAA